MNFYFSCYFKLKGKPMLRSIKEFGWFYVLYELISNRFETIGLC